jgi:hypothetical protein
MISGLERRNICAKLVIAPKQGDYAASRLLRLVSSRAPKCAAMSINCPWDDLGRCSRTHLRKRGSNAAVRRSPVCHVTSRYRAGSARQSSKYTKARKSTLPSCRRSPYCNSLLLNRALLHVFCWAVCKRAPRASAVLPRRHHTTVEGLWVYGDDPGDLGKLPLVRCSKEVAGV